MGTRASEGPIALTVEGPLGRHTTSIDISDELGERGEIDIPIVFECASDISSTRWSLLDFIFQFGANYRGYYLDSDTREPARELLRGGNDVSYEHDPRPTGRPTR